MSNGQPPRVHSRFIPQEEIDDSTVVQWRFGAVDAQSGGVFAPAQPAAFIPAGTEHFNGFSPSIAHQLQPPPQTQAVEPVEPAEPAFDEEQLQQMLEQARAEGHAQGLAEGRTQTQQQWQQQQHHLLTEAYYLVFAEQLELVYLLLSALQLLQQACFQQV